MFQTTNQLTITLRILWECHRSPDLTLVRLQLRVTWDGIVQVLPGAELPALSNEGRTPTPGKSHGYGRSLKMTIVFYNMV